MSEADFQINQSLKGLPFAGRCRPVFNKKVSEVDWFTVEVTGNRTMREKGTRLRVCIADDKYYFIKRKKGVGTIARDQVEIVRTNTFLPFAELES